MEMGNFPYCVPVAAGIVDVFMGKHSGTLTLVEACRHAPAAVASPSWDIDVLPERESHNFQYI